ncbi:MAG: alpha/beta hydrolase [Variovorax sp.]|nr:MAG: alpha/beta hydrolase [Variovorax sp.]
MTDRLVFIHGRAQEHKDAAALKAEWLDALNVGLAANGLTLPIAETAVAFPYYGQTLYDLASSAATVAEVVVRGNAGADKAEQQFQQALLTEMQSAAGITDEEVEAALDVEIKQRGPLNWEWVQGILKVLDERVPGAGAASIALATRDVYQYLKNPGIRDKIEQGVRMAMLPGVPTVVVSHSLGTVVAFNLLRREGRQQGWQVPLLVTVGSPLGARAIRSALSPIEYPDCVGHWFNAMDERDVVALYPLDAEHFDVTPAIENKTDVRNRTSNRHGIAGYLDDPVVARTIHDALVA